MERRDFLAMAALLGVNAFAAPTRLLAQGAQKVIVIGAGAAGLTAGYRLKQRGIDFQILEASHAYGGRMKHNLQFADFPLPLGAEWLHVPPQVFKTIVSNRAVNVAVPTIGYKKNDGLGVWDGDTLHVSEMGADIDRKFVNSSWLGFFERYIIPSIAARIRFRDPVVAIDTTGPKAVVQTQSGKAFEADAVIVTVPLKMLQKRQISFSPPLPRGKTKAIEKAKAWDGFKAFLEFDGSFYPAYTAVEITPQKAGQLGFYDASYGQNTRQHILGVFSVGSAAKEYVGLSKTAVTQKILGQLDEIFDGAATPRFRRIITQDWSNERFIEAAYLQDHENWKRVRQLGSSVGSNLHFAGEAYTDGEDWGSVHAAALSAQKVVDRL